jgi:tetraacyldisaccharide 4'-kinase
VGNLSVGGSGKTPTVEHLARLLLRRGERPAILSRGYGRANIQGGSKGVTVVSDGSRVLASLDAAGDEPLMLARHLPGTAVVVGNSRYRCGRVAEESLGATVHILDDGFQHLALARDVDLLLVSEADLDDRPLPAGRLRERLSAAADADAVLTTAAGDRRERLRGVLGVDDVFGLVRLFGPLRHVNGPATEVPVPGASVVAVSGIARPERFFEDLAAADLDVAERLVFADHHRFVNADVKRMVEALDRTHSASVVTTEKDAVRLTALDLGGLPVAAAALEMTIEPADVFATWLLARMQR